MKYNRYASIPGILTKPVFKEYELPKVQDSDIRIVNDAQYQPNKKAEEVLAKNIALGVLKEMQYDSFEDIKKGNVNTFARKKGRDMAELTQQFRDLEKKAVDGIKDAISKGKEEQAKQHQAAIDAQVKAAIQAQQQNITPKE